MKLKFKQNYLMVILVIIGLIASISLVMYMINAVKSSKKEKINSKNSSKLQNDLLMGTQIKIPGKEKNSYWDLKIKKLSNKDQKGKMFDIAGDYILEGQPTYHIVSETGELDWDASMVVFENKVQLSSNDGKKVTAEKISWDSKQENVIAEKKVVLSFLGYKVNTEKVVFDLKAEKVKFFGDTKIIHKK